jgi:hypothetical protein
MSHPLLDTLQHAIEHPGKATVLIPKEKFFVGTYGVFEEYNGELEIMHSSLTKLFSPTLTMEDFKRYWTELGKPQIVRELENYILVPVQIVIDPTISNTPVMGG